MLRTGVLKIPVLGVPRQLSITRTDFLITQVAEYKAIAFSDCVFRSKNRDYLRLLKTFYSVRKTLSVPVRILGPINSHAHTTG